MALIISNRVREASNTTGLGAFTLSGTALGYQTFSAAIGEGNTTYYAIVSAEGEWEIGLGTITAGQLVRTTVLDSSNSGSLVDFAAGPKDVFSTVPASEVMLADRPQTLTNKTVAFADNTLTGVQPTLISGTNIKTVNGSSLLGSGDLTVGDVTLVGTQTLTNKTVAFADNTLTGVQPTLISGTNLKTVNSSSLLGSGNLAVGDVTLAGEQTLTNKTLTNPVIDGGASGTAAGKVGYASGAVTYGTGSAQKTLATAEDLATTGAGKGAEMVATQVASTGAVARTVSDRNNDRRTLYDFDDKLKAGGTIDAVSAVEKAITAAMENGTGVLAGSGYMDVVIPVRPEGGLLRLDSTVTIPGECFVRFVGEGGPYFQSGFLQGFAGDMFTCAAGNFTAQFHNIRFQGQKSLYAGSYSAVSTLQDAVHAAFIGCMFRDFGGVALDLANVFDCSFDRLIFFGNKEGAFQNTGGASSHFTRISTQVNNGFGLYIAGGGHSGGSFFLEGDLKDNNPAGLNLSHRALKISGDDNLFIGGTLLTDSANDKTPVEFAAGAERSGWIGVAAISKGTATNWVTFGAGSKHCRVGGGLQTAMTGDATAIATCVSDISGPLQAMDNGEMLFSMGSASPVGGRGVHVGFDSVNARGYIKSTEPGVTNLPLDLGGSFVALRAPLGTDQTALASTPGTVVRKLAITNEAGGVLGYVPIYNAIT